MDRHTVFAGRLRARRTVRTRAAVTLIHFQVTDGALSHRALRRVLCDEVVVATHTVRIASSASTGEGVERDRLSSVCRRVRVSASCAVHTRRRHTLFNIDIAVAAQRHRARLLVCRCVLLGFAVPAVEAQTVRKPCRARTRVAVDRRQACVHRQALCAVREAAGVAARLSAGGTVQTRVARTLVDVVASGAVTIPSNYTYALVMAWTEVVACRVERVTVVLQVAADVDRVLTHLAVESLALASPGVDNLLAVAGPAAHTLVARRVVPAGPARIRPTRTLVDIDVTVARQLL